MGLVRIVYARGMSCLGLAHVDHRSGLRLCRRVVCGRCVYHFVVMDVRCRGYHRHVSGAGCITMNGCLDIFWTLHYVVGIQGVYVVGVKWVGVPVWNLQLVVCVVDIRRFFYEQRIASNRSFPYGRKRLVRF